MCMRPYALEWSSIFPKRSGNQPFQKVLLYHALYHTLYHSIFKKIEKLKSNCQSFTHQYLLPIQIGTAIVVVGIIVVKVGVTYIFS